MKLLYDLFHQLYEARLFLELIYDRVIFQKPAFGFCSYSMFLVISFWVIDARYSKFLIIGLLYYAQYYQGVTLRVNRIIIISFGALMGSCLRRHRCCTPKL